MENPIITYPTSKATRKLIIEFLNEIKVKYELNDSVELKNFLELEKGRKEFQNGITKKMSLTDVEDFLQL